jgi:hypothetical protein
MKGTSGEGMLRVVAMQVNAAVFGAGRVKGEVGGRRHTSRRFHPRRMSVSPVAAGGVRADSDFFGGGVKRQRALALFALGVRDGVAEIELIGGAFDVGVWADYGSAPVSTIWLSNTPVGGGREIERFLWGQ